MSPRLFPCLLNRALGAVTALLCLLALPAVALAQDNTQAPTLSQRVRTSEEPTAHQPEIEAFLEYHLQRLFGNDPVAVARSRQQLSAQVGDPSTAAFRGLYAELLTSRLQRQFAAAPTFNQLNAAIVAEALARQTRNARLAPLITMMIEDDDAAVAIWGAKAVYPMFPDLMRSLRAAERDRLLAALVGAVERFPDNGPLAQDVYNALSTQTIEMRPPPEDVLRRVGPLVAPQVQNLVAFRVGRYQPSRPAPMPHADVSGLTFLTSNFVWVSLDDQQKARSVALMRDLMLQATATAGGMDAEAADSRPEVIDVLRLIASAFEGISAPTQPGGPPVHPDLYRTARALRSSSDRQPQSRLEQLVGEVRTAVEQAYPGLPQPELSKRPDEAPPGEETTQPASQPATQGSPDDQDAGGR